ncbi:MAG: SDR family oxidoreductase [Gemmataceae bacterium]
MMTAFRDRTVLITGAASGIGRELACRMAAEGARIAGIDLQPEGLQTLAAQLPAGQVATATASVTDLPALREAARLLESRVGPPDILIASAGLGQGTPATQFDAEAINRILAVNLMGVVNSVDVVLPSMLQRRSGHLVALSSLASFHGLPLMSAYCASKAGVNALFDSLRVELRPHGIAVTTICPGWIRTPMTDPLGLPSRATMPLDRAATIILDAIRRRRPFRAFPFNMVSQVRLLRYLPRPISDWLASRHLARARRLLTRT